MERSRLGEILEPVFTPPFKGLAALVWVYYVFSFLINPNSQILRGNFPDPDDYLYLTQAIDLVRGQNWFDLVQHRMNPPGGVLIHFSHILCLFYAVPIYLLGRLLGLVGAATLVAAVIPPIFLGVFLIAMRWAARPFTGDAWAGVTAFISLFGTYLIFQFTPGHVDHHGLEALLMLIAFASAARMATEPNAIEWPALTGTILAFGLVIGLEILPALIAIVTWLGLHAMSKGGKAAWNGVLFGSVLFFTSFGFLFLTKPLHQLFEPDLLAYSIVYVLFTGGVALVFSGVALAAFAMRAWLRYVLGIGLALATGLAFLHYFPALKAGPYGGMDPALSKLMFDSISEALPILKTDRSWVEIFLFLVWPVMALIAAFYFLIRTTSTERWIWGLLTLLLASSTLLAVFCQIRVLLFAQAISPIPLALMLRNGWAGAAGRYNGCALCAARLGLILLVGPLPMVVLPALADGRTFNTGVLLFPNTVPPNICDLQTLAQMLDTPPYGNRSHLIINTLNEGSELLFRTPHKILAAPYHTNVEGNLDAVKFFTASDPAVAEAIARRHDAEFVVMCKAISDLYRGPPDKEAHIDQQGHAILGKYASLAEQLADGRIPSWLSPVEFPLLHNILLFEIRPPDKTPQP